MNKVPQRFPRTPILNGADPLLTAIEAYLHGDAEYGQLPENLTEEQETEAFNRLCDQPEAALAAWTVPPTSRESALAAFRLGLQIGEEGQIEPTALNLFGLAFAYFQGEST